MPSISLGKGKMESTRAEWGREHLKSPSWEVESGVHIGHWTTLVSCGASLQFSLPGLMLKESGP